MPSDLAKKKAAKKKEAAKARQRVKKHDEVTEKKSFKMAKWMVQKLMGRQMEVCLLKSCQKFEEGKHFDSSQLIRQSQTNLHANIHVALAMTHNLLFYVAPFRCCCSD